MSSGSFKNVIYKICLQIKYLIYVYKKDLALNNQQTKPFLEGITTLQEMQSIYAKPHRQNAPFCWMMAYSHAKNQNQKVSSMN